MSIRTKLTILISLLIAAPLLFSAAFWINTLLSSLGGLRWEDLIWHGRVEVEERAALRFWNTAVVHNDSVVQALSPVGQRLARELTFLGARLREGKCFSREGEFSPACRPLAREFLELHPELEGLLAVSGKRATEVLNGKIAPERIATIQSALMPLAQTGRNVTLQPVQVGGEFLLASLHTPREAPSWTLIVWITTRDFMRPFEGLLSGTFYRTVLANDQGRLLVPLERLGPTETGNRRVLISSLSFQDADQRQRVLESLRDGRGGNGRGILAGTRYIFAYASVPPTGLRVVTLLPLDLPSETRVFGALRNFLVLSAILIILTGVGALFLATRLTRSLRMLTTAAEEIGAGRLDTPIEGKGKDEIARLASSFRTMAEQIKEDFATLEQKVADRTRDLTLKSEELARANEDLLRMSKMKSDFLAKMSHELRTPLNSIIGFSDLVLSGAFGQITDKQRDALGRVVRNAKNLLQLINDILDLSKIEADRLTLKLGPVNLKVLVDAAVGNLEFKALERKISLKAEVDAGIPMLQADEVRLLQILNNLLSNAVKFTHEGGVTLTAALAANGRVLIAVRDTGIGMDAKELSNLFTEFYQADTSRTRKYEGTGLGLAITRRLVEAMGGTIGVESRLAEGSTFTVTLPAVAAGPLAETVTLPPPTPARVTPRPAFKGPRKILVIDDDPEIHTLITENLKDTGSTFLRALDGDAGLKVARETRPDLILLDIRMPNKDGWEVLHDLKANTITAGIPVVIMSSVDNTALGFSLGAADYLIKPVNRDGLSQTLSRLSIGPGSGYILVVDDDEESAAVVKEALEVKNFRVAVASNGKQALQAIAQQLPRLIVLDLMMPVMDGFELLAHLRGEATTKDIPVVILSAKDLTPSERAALDGKIQALFQKGQVTLDQLISDVQSAITRHPAGV
ncbi:MAG: response regulator [Candidatus Rokubacteria bacterium]|nr:response regulator [Candidatus Rokubacteria bacterium]